MKIIQIIAGIAFVFAAIANAVAPPIPAGGLLFKALKPGGAIIYTNGWIVCTDTTGKQTITLDTKSGPAPSGQNIVINGAKGLKGATKTVSPGCGFSNVIYGTFTPGFEGDLSNLVLTVPATSFGVSLKGISVDTLIAQRCAPKCESLKNAIVTEIKPGKGAAVTALCKAPTSNLGGTSAADMGFLGVPPHLRTVPCLMPFYAKGGPRATEARIGKATGTRAIAHLNIFAQSLPERQPACTDVSSLPTKRMVNTHALAKVPGPSEYRCGEDRDVIYDLVLP